MVDNQLAILPLCVWEGNPNRPLLANCDIGMLVQKHSASHNKKINYILRIPRIPETAYSSIGTQAQSKLRSPYTSSMRFTEGQNLFSATQGSGKAAS